MVRIDPRQCLIKCSYYFSDNIRTIVNHFLCRHDPGNRLRITKFSHIKDNSVSLVEAQGYRVVFDMTKFSDPQAITGIMTTQKMINDRPDVVGKVVAALNQALSRIYTNHEEAYQVAAKLFPDIDSNV